jgi:Na+/melibiose symporter-like transporter
VLNLSIVLFLFTDMISNPDTKYLIGWFYIGMIALLVLVNFVAMMYNLFKTIKEEYRRRQIEQENLKTLELAGINFDDHRRYTF